MTVISDSKYLQFKKAKSPSNHDWYYVKRTNDSSKHDSAVAITVLIKIDNEYNFLLLKTKRPPLYAENKAKFCLESPAGLIGDNDSDEDVLSCARKELLEEAGLCADNLFIEQKNSCTSSGLSSETLTYITAFVEEYQVSKEPISDGGIIIDRILVPAKDIRKFLKDIDEKEYSIASALCAGIFYALDRL